MTVALVPQETGSKVLPLPLPSFFREVADYRRRRRRGDVSSRHDGDGLGVTFRTADGGYGGALISWDGHVVYAYWASADIAETRSWRATMRDSYS